MRPGLVVAITAVLGAVALTACGSPGSGAPAPAPAPSATQNDAAQIARFATCIRGYGVNPATPVSDNTVRTALANTPKTERKSAESACKQYLAGTSYLGGHVKKSSKS